MRLLGLDFFDGDAAQAAREIAARPADAPFAYVVTPNADHLVRLARDPSLTPIYQGAWLRLLDSRVVAGCGRLIGVPAPRVATGSDVAAALLSRHVGPDDAVTVIGLDPAHVPALGLRRVAHLNPPMGFDARPQELTACVAFVLAHPARYVLLAVGSPRQERLARAIAATGRAAGTGLCVGAALEFLSGARRRAPGWMRGRGLEWLHRLLSDPARLASRYLRDDPLILVLMWREKRARSGRAG